MLKINKHINMSTFNYKTFGGWVKSLGIKISDLTEDELKDAREEYESRKNGEEVLDGLETRILTITMRKMKGSSN